MPALFGTFCVCAAFVMLETEPRVLNMLNFFKKYDKMGCGCTDPKRGCPPRPDPLFIAPTFLLASGYSGPEWRLQSEWGLDKL